MARNRNINDEWNTDYGLQDNVAGCVGNKVLAEGADSTDINAARVDVCTSKIRVSESPEMNCYPCARTFRISRIGAVSLNYGIASPPFPNDTYPIIPRERQLTMGDKSWFQIAAAKK